MPENVFVSERAIATAGLANDVEAVNQLAAVMWSPTSQGTEARANTRRSWRAPSERCFAPLSPLVPVTGAVDD